MHAAAWEPACSGNPRLAKRLETIRDTSIRDRLLENSAEALEDYLRPSRRPRRSPRSPLRSKWRTPATIAATARAAQAAAPHVTLAQYIELLRAMAPAEKACSGDTPDGVRRWLARTKSLRKRQRAYGSESALRHWIADRARQPRAAPLRARHRRATGPCPFFRPTPSPTHGQVESTHGPSSTARSGRVPRRRPGRGRLSKPF